MQVFMCCLEQEQSCFSDQHIKLKATAESFRYVKARTANVLNVFKNDQSYEHIGDEVQAEI